MRIAIIDQWQIVAQIQHASYHEIVPSEFKILKNQRPHSYCSDSPTFSQCVVKPTLNWKTVTIYHFDGTSPFWKALQKMVNCSVNFLAHAYLSFDRPDILAGNMISDFVKGKKKFGYTTGIQKGIALHRDIDAFTDDHPATRAAADLFRPVYRLYGPAFIDVTFDHFLANDPTIFTEESLFDFSQQVYQTLERQYAILPEKFQGMFPYMKSQNWLFYYRQRSGIARSFEGLVRRSAYLTDSATAFEIFESHFTRLQDLYNQIFPALKAFTSGRLLQLDGE